MSKPVTQLHDNRDTDLTDVRVAVGGRSSILHTTAHHPFWDESTGQWTDASALHAGDLLRTSDGHTAKVIDTHRFAGARQMRDLTVADIHTYYVLAGTTPVLVHNCGGALKSASEAAFKAADDPSSIFIKNKHLADFQVRYAKFDTTDISETQSWVAEELKSDRAVFRPNGDGSFKVEVDMGRSIGTKGQTGIRVMVNDEGRAFNAFPINIG